MSLKFQVIYLRQKSFLKIIMCILNFTQIVFFFVKDRETQATLLQGPSKDILCILSIVPNASPVAYIYPSVQGVMHGYRRLGHPLERVLLNVMQKFNLPCSNKSLRTSMVMYLVSHGQGFSASPYCYCCL